MAQGYAMQTRNGALKNDIQRLTLELSSGRVADVRKAVGGNLTYLNDLERSLKKLDGYDLATREAGQFAEGIQTALSQVATLNSSLRDTLITSQGSALGEGSENVLAQAKGTLDDMIAALNTTVGGRSLFAGNATDLAAVAPTNDLLAALSVAVAGAGNVDDILVAAQAWFDDPAGYAATAYLGSNVSLSAMSLTKDETANFDLRADDPILRNALKNIAVMALADDPALALTTEQQNELFQKSLSGVLGTVDPIIDLAAKTGFSENRIESAIVRNGSERTSLEIARTDLLATDPFKTATELEQVQFQLQSLYAITSRMSQLSLVNFL